MAVVRIAPERPLHQQRQAIGAVAHSGLVACVSASSEELSPAAAHSGNAATPPARTETVEIGDSPYIPACLTIDRQPEMKSQSHRPSLGCELAAGVLGEVFAC